MASPALNTPRPSRPRPVCPVVGRRALDSLGPLTVLPMSAAIPSRPRFPSLSDLSVILLALALVVAVLHGLEARDAPRPAVDGACAVPAGEAGCPSLPRRG